MREIGLGNISEALGATWAFLLIVPVGIFAGWCLECLNDAERFVRRVRERK